MEWMEGLLKTSLMLWEDRKVSCCSQVILIKLHFLVIVTILNLQETLFVNPQTSTQEHSYSDGHHSGTLRGESTWVSRSTKKKYGWLGTQELFVSKSRPFTALRLFSCYAVIGHFMYWAMHVSPSWHTSNKSHVAICNIHFPLRKQEKIHQWYHRIPAFWVSITSNNSLVYTKWLSD